jgi:hypothetical protein
MHDEKSTDRLSAIRSLSGEIATSEAYLRKAFRHLEAGLVEALQGVSMAATSDHVVLWEVDDVHYVTGALKLCDGELTVVSRSTEDDTEYVVGSGPVAAELQYYELDLEKVPVKGLNALAGAVESLLLAVASNLQAQVQENNQSATVVLDATEQALHALSQSLIGTATQLEYVVVSKDWTKAQNAIEVDPARAITAARSLVESVCKHILHSLSAPLPSTGREPTWRVLKGGHYGAQLWGQRQYRRCVEAHPRL